MTVRVLNVKPRDGKELCHFLFYLCCTKPSSDHALGLADLLREPGQGLLLCLCSPLGRKEGTLGDLSLSELGRKLVKGKAT